jgi:hypothetical protein
MTRLIRRVASSHDDPAYFEQVTGLPQEHGRFTLGGTSGWTVMNNAYLDDPAVASIASPKRLVYPLFAGSGRRIGGHPKFWHPGTVDRVADWIGLSHFYVWVVGFVMIGVSLSVVCWARGRKITAAAALIPPVWPIALLICLRRPRAGSWWMTSGVSKGHLIGRVATCTLLLTTLISTGIGFLWTYLLLRIV